MSSEPRTRRQLVGLGTPAESRQLARLVALERLAADVYGLALGSGLLDPRARALAIELRDQELSHARAVAELAGPLAVQTAVEREPVQRRLQRAGIRIQLARLHSERGWIYLLERTEGSLARAYHAAIGRLPGGEPALLAATILASEAQHATLLHLLRHPARIGEAVPAAVVPPGAGQ
jgi:hypothetical protein